MPCSTLKIHILVYCCLMFLPARGQTGSSELLSKLAKAPNDSQKIFAYRELIVYYSTVNLDSANWYAEQGIKFSHNSHYALGEGLILAQQAILDENQGRVELGTERTYKALKLYRKLNYLKGVAEMLHNLGAIEASKGNYDIAAKRFIEALKVYDSVTDNHGLMLTYMNLGNLYMQDHRDTAQALKYLRLAEKTSKTIPVSEATIFLYNTLGVIYDERGDSISAEQIFLENVRLSNKPEFADAHAESQLYLGEFYSERGNVEKALKYLLEGQNTAREYHLPEIEANILMEMAKLLESNNPSKAIEYLEQAKKICLGIHSKAFLEAIYAELAKIYKSEGKYKEALDATEQRQIVHDSIFNINKEKEIASITSSYELAQSKLKVNELQRISSVNAKERDVFIAIAVIIVVMLGVLFFYYRRTTELNRQLIAHDQELKELNSMKDKLFSVIGHDLRGPIARIPTILDLYESEGVDDAEKKFLLESLKDQTKVSLETFDKLLYWGQSLIKGIRLQQMKMKPKLYVAEAISLRKLKIAEKELTVTDNTPNDLSIYADPALFDFVIRNLIGNAMKYTPRGGCIQINADTRSRPGFAVFSVKDNGIGIDKAVQARIFSSLKSTVGTDNEKGHGIGLMLCKEFAELNGGDIWLESEPGKGATFYFSVKNAA